MEEELDPITTTTESPEALSVIRRGILLLFVVASVFVLIAAIASK